MASIPYNLPGGGSGVSGVPLNPPVEAFNVQEAIDKLIDAVRTQRLDVWNAKPVDLIHLRLSQCIRRHYDATLGYTRNINILDARRLQDKWVVFVIDRDERALILEDDLGLFPSDGLITRLRLLMEDKT
jgi:hypothetical protein